MTSPALVWSRFDPGAVAISRSLRRRLARCPRRPLAATGSLALAAAALDLAPPARAPILRLADGCATDGRVWFLAEAVQLLADRDSLRLGRLDPAPLTPDESTKLIAAAREHFADADVLFEAGASGRWYFSAAGIADARLVPPEDAQAGSFEAIPAGADGRALARMLTELQMLWHVHPVNRARHSDGRPEANALWVWEGGRLPPPPRLAEQATLFASAPEIAGFAVWAGLQRESPRAFDTAGDEDAPVVIVIEAEETAPGREWLRRFDARRREYRLFVDGAALTVPARRGFLRPRLA